MAGNSGTMDGRRGRRWRPYMWGGAVALLLLPLIAMQFTSEVVWGPADFIVMGGMLGLLCFGFDLLARQSGSLSYRLGAASAVLGCFLLVWVNLAVGFIGEEFNPANLMFLALLAAFVIGAVMARLKASGMARVMLVMAAIQGAIAIVAFGIGETDTRGIVLGTGMFLVIWLVSALLFRKAAGALA
jgi:hypothetical protein